MKQRLLRNIERKEFCKMINAEKKTVELWELHGLVPAAKSIKKICDLLELPLEYFCDYYSLYFEQPEKLFLKWKEENYYSFYDCVQILDSSKSALLSFTTGKFGLSYDMYLKMKKVGIF